MPGRPAWVWSLIQSAIRFSHGHRSSSVSGTPAAIFATLAGGWKSSASAYGQPSRRVSSTATVVLPEPATPMITTCTGSAAW